MDKEIKKRFEQEVDDALKQFISEEKHKVMNMYTGKVEDNNDPDQLGRCRIRIFGIFDSNEITTEDLPWAKPDNHFVGSTKGSMVIPPVNTLVRVYFDNGDIYNPVYTTKVSNTVQKPTNVSEDYPNNMIFFETDNGDFLQINRLSFELYFYHASGLSIQVDKDGNMIIDNKDADGSGNITFNAKGNINLNSETGNVSIEANQGKILLGGDSATQAVPNVPVSDFTGSPHTVGQNFPGVLGATYIRP